MQSRWIRAIKVSRPVANPNVFCRSASLLQASNMQQSSVGARIQSIMTIPVSWQMQRAYFSTETGKGKETMAFQAETRKLLDIVTHSIYSDKEVFVRELISNASDALEKLRYSQVKGVIPATADQASSEFKIEITTDKTNNTLTLIDTGIGMTREELVSNLGTIARSGSKQFVDEHAAPTDGSTATKADTGIIGQFGVGFYSAFMVADRVDVESRSALTPNGPVYKWSSDGAGEFSIEESSASFPLAHGTRLTLHLKAGDIATTWTDPDSVRAALKKHSSFVPFPVSVDKEVLVSAGALWARDPKGQPPVTDQEYTAFYHQQARAWDDPRYRLHFRADAPLEMKVLLFVPERNMERLGMMGVTPPGVDLYCRKVLIELAPKDLLPDWLRFIRGVVDSEDLPLALSREKSADAALIRRLREALTRRILRMLSEEMKKDLAKYQAFYEEFGVYLKQGCCQDAASMDSLSKLLLFESTAREPTKEGPAVTLEDYVARCPPDQKVIYYCLAPNRAAALASPYLEAFDEQKEVLLVYATIDEFVMANLKAFQGRKIVNVEAADAVTSSSSSSSSSGKAGEEGGAGDEAKKSDSRYEQELVAWLTLSLGPRVKRVAVSRRLKDSPAIVTEHESGALRRMMKLVEQAQSRDGSTSSQSVLPPQVLEVNANHPLLRAIHRASKTGNEKQATLVAEQLFDNALVAAGLLEDARHMLPRLTDLLLAALPQEASAADSKVVEAEVLPPK